MKNVTNSMKCLVLAGCIFAAAPAFADTTTTTVTTRNVVIRDIDRPVITEYVQTHRTYCPAGTVPTHGECLLPSKVIVYQRGEVIPDTVHYEVLPTTVTTRLAPPPEGATYVAADGNVYVVDAKSRAVIDSMLVPEDVR